MRLQTPQSASEHLLSQGVVSDNVQYDDVHPTSKISELNIYCISACMDVFFGFPLTVMHATIFNVLFHNNPDFIKHYSLNLVLCPQDLYRELDRGPRSREQHWKLLVAVGKSTVSCQMPSSKPYDEPSSMFEFIHKAVCSF